MKQPCLLGGTGPILRVESGSESMDPSSPGSINHLTVDVDHVHRSIATSHHLAAASSSRIMLHVTNWFHQFSQSQIQIQLTGI